MPKCIFKLVTGYDCPGCGFQRAIHALLHGHIAEAIRYNLFFAIGFPYLLALLFARHVLPVSKQQKIIAVLEGKVMIYTYIILTILWFFIRNILNI